MSQKMEVRVPDLGNFSDVEVIDVLVKAGDTIEVDAPLITLETEKATMDVPSTAAGVVEKVHVEKGGKVSEGSLVVTLRAAAARRRSTGGPASRRRTDARTGAARGSCCGFCSCGRAPRRRCGGAGHGQLHRSRRHRSAGQGRRQGGSGYATGHAGDREGHHGRAVHCRRHGQGGTCAQGRYGIGWQPRGDVERRGERAGDGAGTSGAERAGSRTSRRAAARRLLRPRPHRHVQRVPCRRSTRPVSAARMPDPRCARWPASWVSTWVV